MSGPGRETPIVSRALDALAVRAPGAKYWRSNSGGNKSGHRCNSINLVDIVGWQKHGMALACEVKAHDGQLTKDQHDFLADVERRGGLSLVYAPTIKDGYEAFYRWGAIPEQFMPAQPRKGAK